MNNFILCLAITRGRERGGREGEREGERESEEGGRDSEGAINE